MASHALCLKPPEIPSKFMQYAEDIKQTVRETVSFKLTESSDLKLWQSKVGGDPYLPLSIKYPCNANGQPLIFLMQINFSEVPQLTNYPKAGILQFYIDGRDICFGLNHDDPTLQEGFKVVYFENSTENDSELQKKAIVFDDDDEDIYGPFMTNSTQYSLSFCHEYQYITGFDYRIQNLPFGEDENLLHEYMYDDAFECKHRIGGYPNFTQQDPRQSSKEFEDYELLVQLDSEESLMFGDAGICSFFIHPDHLAKCDFSKVLYNWDN